MLLVTIRVEADSEETVGRALLACSRQICEGYKTGVVNAYDNCLYQFDVTETEDLEPSVTQRPE